MAIVRSLHHEMSSHNDGSIELLTGKKPFTGDPLSVLIRANLLLEPPSPSVVSKLPLPKQADDLVLAADVFVELEGFLGHAPPSSGHGAPNQAS